MKTSVFLSALCSDETLANAKPFRVREERQVVDRQHDRDLDPKRCGVSRRKPDIEVIVCGGGERLDLFPPCAAGSGDEARPKTVSIEADRERLRGVQDEFVLRGSRSRRPLGQQPCQVPSDAGRVTAELAGVYANPHASWYVS